MRRGPSFSATIPIHEWGWSGTSPKAAAGPRSGPNVATHQPGRWVRIRARVAVVADHGGWQMAITDGRARPSQPDLSSPWDVGVSRR